MADLSDAGLLLRRIPYSETSLICHFLTEHHGRIALMARGARRAKSPFRATLAPLYHLQLSWKSGRTGMGTLIDVQRQGGLLEEAKSLSGLELLALASGLYQEGDPEGYPEILQALHLLAERSEKAGLLAASWELLHASGWIGDLCHCWLCGEEVDAEAVMFWQSHLCCDACGEGDAIGPGLRKSIAGVMNQATVQLSDRDARAWKKMIELVLREHGVRFVSHNYV